MEIIPFIGLTLVFIILTIVVWYREVTAFNSRSNNLLSYGIQIFTTPPRELPDATETLDLDILKGHFTPAFQFKKLSPNVYIIKLSSRSIKRKSILAYLLKPKKYLYYAILFGFIFVNTEKKIIYAVGRLRWSVLLVFGVLLWIICSLKWGIDTSAQIKDMATFHSLSLLILIIFSFMIITFHYNKFNEMVGCFLGERVQE